MESTFYFLLQAAKPILVLITVYTSKLKSHIQSETSFKCVFLCPHKVQCTKEVFDVQTENKFHSL